MGLEIGACGLVVQHRPELFPLGHAASFKRENLIGGERSLKGTQVHVSGLIRIQGVPKVRSSTLEVCSAVLLDLVSKSWKQVVSFNLIHYFILVVPSFDSNTRFVYFRAKCARARVYFPATYFLHFIACRIA